MEHLDLSMTTRTKQSLRSCLTGRSLPRLLKPVEVAPMAATNSLTPAPRYEGTLATLLPMPQGDCRMSPALIRAAKARGRERRGSVYFKSHPTLTLQRIRRPSCLSRHPVAADTPRDHFRRAERLN